MFFDSDQFPRVRAYLDRLPDGLGSYPDALIHRDLVGSLRAFLGPQSPHLPPVLEEFVDGRNQDEWVPEVWAATLHLAARDLSFRNDAEAFDWARHTNAQVSRGPMGRMVLRAGTPDEAVAQFARRWATYHRGTSMGVGELERDGELLWVPVVLQFPAHLWNEFHLRRGAAAFETVLTQSRAEGPRVRLERSERDEAWYHLAWRREAP